MRCEAVLRGGAEAEPPEVLSQLSCVEAGGGRGVSPCSRRVARHRATAASCSAAKSAVR